ncbi:MAG: Gfo/Idh/MocA family oxidoreductase [Bacteroidales bacterium]
MGNKKTIKWGILGCGRIANKFAEALGKANDSVRFAAASRDAGRAADFAAKWGFEKSYGSYTELLNDPELDIVYIATPHSFHFAHTKRCLEAGKHVLCEKPFTINADQLEVLITLARSRKLFLMEALWSRFLPGIIETKALLDNGVIGDVITMEADFGINFPFDPESRIFNPHLAGGALLDIGIYPLFLSLFLFGKPAVMKAHSVLNDNKIDLTTSLISQSTTGTVSHLNSTIQAATPVKARIFGTMGNIEFGNKWFTPVNITLRIDGEKEEVLEFPPLANGYEYEAMEAVSCLQQGLTESRLMSHEFSMLLMKQMDQIRQTTGITYPAEIENINKPYGWEDFR